MAKKTITKTSNHDFPPMLHAKEEEILAPPSSSTAADFIKCKVEEQPAAAAPAAPEKQGTPALPPSVGAPQKEKEEHPILKSVNSLCDLSGALSNFKHRWVDLQNHLDSIHKAIDARSKQLDTDLIVSLKEQHQQQQQVATDASKNPVLDDLPIQDSTQESPNGDLDVKQSSRSDLEYLCETMRDRGLRKYVISNLTDVAKLRESLPAAIQCAPNPAKLVLDCIGRFYLQGSRAYTTDSPMIPARLASVLILEFFLLAGCSQIDSSIKEEAETAAIAWRKRLILEGGVSKVNSIDARGLLLFVGSYGIPSVFKNNDLGDLIRLSNPREISDALRRSKFLLERIPDIIQNMVKNGVHTGAVDVVCTFGVEDKFPPQTIITSFLRESKDSWKRARRDAHGLAIPLKEANEKQLAILKSVVKCLEDHKLDPLKNLSGWNIKDKIANLEKENVDLDRKIGERAISKRKAEEIESSKKLRTQEVKRPWPTSEVSLHGPSMMMLSQEHRTVGPTDGNNLYNGFVSKNFIDSGFPGLLNEYSGASTITSAAVPNGSDATMLNGNVNTFVGINGGVATGAGVHPTGRFAGIGGAAIGEDLGQMKYNSLGQYGWPRHGAFIDNSVGQSFTGQHTPIGKDLIGPAPSVEQGFSGLPTIPSLGGANWSSGSNLYQFADSVFEGESYYSNDSRTGNPMPTAAPAHHSFYLH